MSKLVIFNACFLGTKIIYERAFLMKMRNSPLARTPPANLPVIPGVTAPKDANRKSPEKEHKESDMTHHLSTVTGVHFANFPFITTNSLTKTYLTESTKEEEEMDQFDMDI